MILQHTQTLSGEGASVSRWYYSGLLRPISPRWTSQIWGGYKYPRSADFEFGARIPVGGGTTSIHRQKRAARPPLMDKKFCLITYTCLISHAEHFCLLDPPKIAVNGFDMCYGKFNICLLATQCVKCSSWKRVLATGGVSSNKDILQVCVCVCVCVCVTLCVGIIVYGGIVA